MILHVQVTQDDIEKGWVGDVCLCPVARAVDRALSGGRVSYVMLYEIHIGNRHGETTAKVPAPDNVIEFVELFDDCRHVDPFSFDLNVPDAAVLS